jgi:hypothetical protein
MWQQLVYFRLGIIRLLGKNKLRIIHIWISRAFIGIFIYRVERVFADLTLFVASYDHTPRELISEVVGRYYKEQKFT